MSPEEKKNIFQKVADAFSSRDEKAEAVAAKQEADTAKAALEKAQVEAARLKAEAEAAKAAAAKASAEAQAKIESMKQEKSAEDLAAAVMRAAQNVKIETGPKIITKHKWTSDDTYASLAQKFYGAFTEPYWRLIYDHNKALIGDHPNKIKVGMEIEIPELPDTLKKK